MFGWFTEPVQTFTELYLQNYLEKYLADPKAASEAIKVLFVTECETFALSITRDLLECAKVFDAFVSSNEYAQTLIATRKTNVNFVNELIEYVFSTDAGTAHLLKVLQAHSDKFNWKKNNYFATSYVSPKDVLSELVEENHFTGDCVTLYYSKKIVTAEKSKIDSLSAKCEIFKKLPAYYQSVVSIANSIGSDLHDRRKMNIMISNSVFDCLLSIVSRATKTELKNIHLLIPQELRDFFKNPSAYTERFAERNKMFLCLQTDFPVVDEDIEKIDIASEDTVLSWRILPTEYPYIAEGEYARKALKEINLTMNLFDDSEKSINELRGVAVYYDANKPILEGIVRVIKDPKNEHLLDGEILVATTTTPDFYNDMMKSKAIITNQSGQATHAAITSREQKIPTIIGTKYATYALRTGQKVRIDFNNGTVVVIE